MILKQIGQSTKPAFSFEFFPPRTDKAQQTLFKTARELAELNPAFFSMTYGAGGSTRGKTVVLAWYLQGLSKIDTMCHLTCVDQSRQEVLEVLRDIELLGMKNILALRGDPPADVENWQPPPEGFHYASELVSEIRSRSDEEISIGVAGFPEVHPDAPDRETDLKYLKHKVDCGADAIITQLFFDNEHFFRFERDARAIGIEAPIIPGILPIINVVQLRRFCAACKTGIPDSLNRDLEQYVNDPAAAREYGIQYAAQQIEELLEHGVPAIHLYCLNKAYSVQKIIKTLGI